MGGYQASIAADLRKELPSQFSRKWPFWKRPPPSQDLRYRPSSFVDGRAPKPIEAAEEIKVKFQPYGKACLLAGAMCCICMPGPAGAKGEAARPATAAVCVGLHDFDFDMWVWKTHIKRILDPLLGSSQSVELSGTVRVRQVWDGRARLEDIKADGSNGHRERLSLFLYNPEAHR